MPNPRIITPGEFGRVSTHELLETAAAGYAGLDHRFLHAILDRPEESFPDLLRFALEDREDDRVDLIGDLFQIFRYLDRPEALPFYVEMVRQQPEDVEDELIFLFRRFGAAALEPLLKLHEELAEENAGDVPFLLAGLNVRDPRILNLLLERLEFDVSDAALCLDVYGDPAAIPALRDILEKIPADEASLRHEVESAIDSLRAGPKSAEPDEPIEKFDIWEYYPDTDIPAFDVIPAEERLELLEHPSAELRAQVATSFMPEVISTETRARLLEVARGDSDANVRGRVWEALGGHDNAPEIVNAMLAVVRNPDAPLEERTGAVVGLAQQTDLPEVRRAIEELYGHPATRAKALEAMWRAADKVFAAYPPKHLDDPDMAVRRQAIWGVGYMGLDSEAGRLRALFKDDEFRPDALFCYALAAPMKISRYNAETLMKDIDRMAGGLNDDEMQTVGLAIDQRLVSKGLRPLFGSGDHEFEDEDEPPAAVSTKVGRNDPCPCGSGKKYKKCCGA
jgi:hypothetical protein